MFASRDSLHGRGLAAEAREGDDGLGRPRIPERAAHRRRLERRLTADQVDVPERSGDEILPLPLSFRDEPEGGCLNPAGREDLMVRCAFDREEASENGSPSEINPLARGGSLGEGPVGFCQRLERMPHLRG